MVDLSRDSVRDALKRIHDTSALTACSLALLAATQIIIAQRPDAARTGQGMTRMQERGQAVRTLLEMALAHIKPSDVTVHIQDTSWRAYQAVYEHYVMGHSRTTVEDSLHISRTELYRRLERGLDGMVAFLREAEHKAHSILSSGKFRDAMPGQAPLTSGQAISSAPPRPSHDPLIGREQDLSRVQSSLNRHRGVVAVHGMPGIGKTLLAVTLANDADMLKRFPDGVVWASLGQGGNVLATLVAWAQTLGVDGDALRDAQTAQDIGVLIQDMVIAQRQRILFIVDDVWHIGDAAPFLTACKDSMLLLTTRKPVIAGAVAEAEHVIRLEELGETDSLALLRHHAPCACKMCPSASLELAQACAGLPLALVVAGRHLQITSHGNQERRIRSAFQALMQAEFRLSVPAPFGDSGVGALQRAFERSDRVAEADEGDESGLDGASRMAWYALSTFMAAPMSLSEDAAVWVSEGTTDALDGLVDHGVLTALPADRYTLHPALAEYARSKLQTQADAYMRAVERLVSYYLEWSWRHAEDDAVLGCELPQLGQAMDLARQYGHHIEFVKMVHALPGFLARRGQDDELIALLEQAHTICLSLMAGATGSKAGELALLKARTALLLAEAELRSGRPAYAQGWCDDVLTALPEGLGVDLAEFAQRLQNEIGVALQPA